MVGPKMSDPKMSDYSCWHCSTAGNVQESLASAPTCAAQEEDHGRLMQGLWQRDGDMQLLLILIPIICERGNVREGVQKAKT